jgi:uncharacterized protein YbbC (DUF1343 family)
VTDRAAYRPVATTLALLQTVRKSAGAKLEFHAGYFDKVLGTSLVREAFERDEPFEKIAATWTPGLAEFAQQRAEFLLYR